MAESWWQKIPEQKDWDQFNSEMGLLNSPGLNEPVTVVEPTTPDLTPEDDYATEQYREELRLLRAQKANEGVRLLNSMQGKPERGPEKAPEPGPSDWSSWAAWVSAGAEAPKQMAAGIDDLGRNVLGFLNPITNFLNEHVADLRYDPVEASKTSQGQVLRKVTEYIGAFAPISKGFQAAGMTGKALNAFSSGILADIAVRVPGEDRVADLLLKMGVPENKVLKWLKNDDNDSTTMDILKTGVEGAGLGLAGEAFILAARASKAAGKYIRGKKDDIVAPQVTQAELDKITGEQVMEKLKSMSLGDAVLVSAKLGKDTLKGKRAQATRSLKEWAKTQGSETFDPDMVKPLDLPDGDKLYVNYPRIEKDEDVVKVIESITEQTRGLIDDAKRGVLGHAAQRELAEKLGMREEDIILRAKGEVWPAEKVIAARMLWENAAANVELAVRRATENPTKANLFLFRKMTSNFAAVNASIRGASAESSRSLNAWGVFKGDLRMTGNLLDRALLDAGGDTAILKMANQMKVLIENGTFMGKQGVKFTDRVSKTGVWDAIRESWVASLLFQPSTHIVNLASGMGIMLHQMGLRGVASAFSKDVYKEESLFYAIGAFGSFKDALRMAGKTWKGLGDTPWGRADMGHTPKWTAEAFGAKSDTILGGAIDGVGSAMRSSLKALGATDAFLKMMLYRGELMATAARTARQQGLHGEALEKHIANFMSNPPESIKMQAIDASMAGTFQDKAGSIAEFIAKYRNDPTNNMAGRFLATLIFPFVRTPARILNYATENSPFGVFSKSYKEAIESGDPARAALARTKVATGTMVMGVAMDMADSGTITGGGPRDPGERQAWLETHEPYSIKVGGKWYSYNRLDPLGMTFGFAADMGTLFHRYEMGDADMNEASEMLSGAVLAVGNLVINKNYMQGLAKTLNAVSDPDRYGKWWATSTASTFLPFGSLFSRITRSMDNEQLREINGFRDAYYSKLFNLAKRLTPVRNLWGEPMHKRSGEGALYDFLTPVAVKPVNPSPIDNELLRLAQSAYRGDQAIPRRIGKNTTFEGVSIDFSENPKVYDRYVRLAGNDLKISSFPGMKPLGLKDALIELVTGDTYTSKEYKKAPDQVQLQTINALVEVYRKAARVTILEEDKEFREWFELRMQNSAFVKMGAEGAVLPGALEGAQ